MKAKYDEDKRRPHVAAFTNPDLTYMELSDVYQSRNVTQVVYLISAQTLLRAVAGSNMVLKWGADKKRTKMLIFFAVFHRKRLDTEPD